MYRYIPLIYNVRRHDGTAANGEKLLGRERASIYSSQAVEFHGVTGINAALSFRLVSPSFLACQFPIRTYDSCSLLSLAFIPIDTIVNYVDSYSNVASFAVHTREFNLYGHF